MMALLWFGFKAGTVKVALSLNDRVQETRTCWPSSFATVLALLTGKSTNVEKGKAQEVNGTREEGVWYTKAWPLQKVFPSR